MPDAQLIPTTPPESPPASPPAAAPPSATPAVSPDRLAQAEAELASYKQQAEQSQIEGTLQDWIGRRTQNLIDTGWAEASARQYAQVEGERARARFELIQVTQDRDNMARLAAAQLLGTEYGVPLEQLMAAQTLPEMRRLGTSLRDRNKELNDLKARVARFERGTVPDQKYDSGVGAGVMSDTDFERYASEYPGTWPPEMRKRVIEIQGRR